MVTLQHKVLEADTMSKSGSWYPAELVSSFASSFDKSKPVYGMLEDKANKPNDMANVSATEASHRVTDFVMSGKNLMAVIETTDTVNGRRLERYIRKQKDVTMRASFITDTVKMEQLMKGKFPVRRVAKMNLFSVTANMQ